MEISRRICIFVLNLKFILNPMKRFLALCLVLTITHINAQVNILWQQRYTYTGTGNFVDQVKDMTTDANGNIYVTGIGRGPSGNFDYVTVKYDGAGVFQWVSFYNGAGNSLDEARAIAVDANGNSYVTGWSAGSATNYNCVTVKYNSAGSQQWASVYDRNGLNDEGRDIALDNAGNVYVCGNSESATTMDDFMLVKYNNSGAQQWQANFNTTRTDQAIKLFVDNAGNSYVTGQSETTTTSGFNIVTLKYNTSGTVQYTNTYANVTSGDDMPFGITVNGSGEAFVTGTSLTTFGTNDFDCITLKIGSTGTQVWNKRFGTVSGDDDQGNAISLDGSGNVIVTGRYFTNTTAQDVMVLKYDNTASGNLLWSKTFNAPSNNFDEGKSVIVDASNDIYVTGFSYNSTQSNNFVTLKFLGATGNIDWLIYYNGLGNNTDKAESVRLDAQNNVIVSGTSRGLGTNDDFETIKYCQLKANAGLDTAICLGGSMPLTASATGAISYAWTDTTGASYGSAPTITVTPGATMKYVVAITNSIGCLDYDTVRVRVYPLPGPVISAGGPTTFCIGDSVTLTSNTFTTYAWSPGGQTSQSITVSSTGTYSVLVSDTNTCSSQSSISVTVNNLPNINIASDTAKYCVGSSPLVICVGGGNTYAWTDGALNTISDTTIACPQILPSASMYYIANGTDLNGCKNKDSIYVQVNTPPSTPAITWQNGTTLFTTSAVSYQWYDFNCSNSTSTPIVGETNQSFVPSANGCYIVEVFDANGCSSFSAPFNLTAYGINEINSEAAFKMYPNPASDKIKIELINHATKSANVNVFSAEGKLVMNFDSDKSVIEIEINSLDAGFYFIEVKLDNGATSREKLIIKR